MAKSIVLLGALDTKGEEFAFVKGLIQARGHLVLVVNTGVLGDPKFVPDVSADEVAQAGNSSLDALRTNRDRGQAMTVMSQGAALVVERLYQGGKLGGILGMGGTGGSAVASAAMRGLPIGVPKVLVTTAASGNTAPYVGTRDITLIPSVVDVAGLNRISRRIFTNAAGAVCGMVEEAEQMGEVPDDKPLIAASMFGNTTPAVDRARATFEQAGYEVLVFHATGTGGKTMESLIGDGFISGVFDLTTTEWADELAGGVFTAGPARLEAAAYHGVPQVVAPGCIDMVNFGPRETVPAKYEGRTMYVWNPSVTLMRTTPEENKRLGQIFAEKLNAAKGPVQVFIPRKGVSMLDSAGQPFWAPEADEAFSEELKRHLRPNIPVRELDANINDDEFVDAMTSALLEMLEG
jgi:uncharacterized protein (UPF0261 family)